MKIGLSRRGLLRALPALPLAGSAAKAHMAVLTGATAITAGDSMAGYPMAGAASGMGRLRGRAAAALLRIVGIPAWKRKEIREGARMSRQIDPDIAALRSVSFSYMMHKQWQRNEKRGEARIFEWMSADDERNDFMNKHNLDWF